jgi:hypothetical protein
MISGEDRDLNERKVFGLIARVLGLIIALYGLWSFETGVTHWVFPVAPLKYSNGFYLFLGAVCIVVGLALIRGDWLVRFSYGSGEQPN